MSTILEAVREREQRLGPAGESSIAWTASRRWSPLLWVLVAGLIAAAAVMLVTYRESSAPRPQQPEIATDLRRPIPAPEREARSVPVPSEPPRARVERRRPGTPPPPTPPAVVSAAPTDPAPAVVPETGAPAPLAATESQHEPSVRLRSIGYVAAAERRSATLTIDGGPAVTLRQGESASGVEVQLILRDAVYVRHGADVFAVGVER